MFGGAGKGVILDEAFLYSVVLGVGFCSGRYARVLRACYGYLVGGRFERLCGRGDSRNGCSGDRGVDPGLSADPWDGFSLIFLLRRAALGCVGVVLLASVASASLVSSVSPSSVEVGSGTVGLVLNGQFAGGDVVYVNGSAVSTDNPGGFGNYLGGQVDTSGLTAGSPLSVRVLSSGGGWSNTVSVSVVPAGDSTNPYAMVLYVLAGLACGWAFIQGFSFRG